MTSSLRPVLAAEDEASDAFLLRLVFERARIPNPLVIVGDGQEAMDYVLGAGPFQDRSRHPFPVLLFLDLKMPRMSGFEVLASLGGHAELSELPAVILSSSSDREDIRQALRLGAREYLIKPQSLSELTSFIRAVYDRWIAPGPQRVAPA
ncbi:MAG TPA: response regulator [Planctomycetota bacterium]|nr:response regulator [Planctomycetota bacterium]